MAIKNDAASDAARLAAQEAARERAAAQARAEALAKAAAEKIAKPAASTVFKPDELSTGKGGALREGASKLLASTGLSSVAATSTTSTAAPAGLPAFKFDPSGFFKSADATNPLPAVPATTVPDDGMPATAPTGAEAAARLTDPEMQAGGNAELQQAQQFLDTVQAHQNDPAYLQDLYKTLGPDLVGKLMGNAVAAVSNDNHNTYPNEADAKAALGAVANGLALMDPSFQQAAGAAAAQYPRSAVVLEQPGAPDAAKLSFLDGIKSAATGDGFDASFAARMAGEVIASDPAMLQHVAQSWAPADVTKLLKNGLTTPPITDSFHSDWPLLTDDGLERMVGQTASLTGPQNADFRTRVFRDASLALDDTTAGDPMRKGLVDNLKTLFQSDAQGITSRLFDNDGAADSPYDSSQKALGLFFRDAMFGKPDPKDPFTAFASSFMGDLRSKMLDPANKNADPSCDLYAKQLGDVLGSVAAGYTMAVKQNGESQEARKALVESVVGLIATPIDGGGVVGSMAKDQAEKLATQMLSDFLNGDLKADRNGMDTLMSSLLDAASAGARNFDSKNGTDTETALKTEAVWVNFVRTLFGG